MPRDRADVLLNFGYAALALGFLMPGHYVPWSAFEQQAMAAVGFAAVAAVALVTARGEALRPGAIGWTAFGLAFVPPLQWAAGQVDFLSDALLPTLYLAALGLAVVTGRALIERRGSDGRTPLFAALAVAAAISAAIAWAQWLQQTSVVPWANPVQPGGRSWANLGQPNHLATLLGIGVVVVVDAYERKRIGGGVATLALAFIGAAMVMSQSRTGWLCVSVLAVWWLWQRKRARLRLRPRAIAIGCLFFYLLVMSWEAVNFALLLDPPSLAERLRPGTRLIHWRSMLDAIARQPWLGYGWNQVSVAQLAVAIDHPASGEPLLNAHNVLLDLAIWIGVPLGLTAGATIVGWWVQRVRNCHDLASTQLLAIFMVVGIHALLEYPLDYAYFLLPWGMAIGMVDGLRSAALRQFVALGHPRTRLPLLPMKAARGIALAAVVLFGAVLIEYLRVDASVRELRLQLAGIATGSAVSVAPPDVILLDAPREFYRFTATQAQAGLSEADLDWMRKVVHRHPFPPVLLRYALAAGLNGQPEVAALTLRRLCKIHPQPRCEEARDAWAALQRRYPVLQAVPAPQLPIARVRARTGTGATTRCRRRRKPKTSSARSTTRRPARR